LAFAFAFACAFALAFVSAFIFAFARALAFARARALAFAFARALAFARARALAFAFTFAALCLPFIPRNTFWIFVAAVFIAFIVLAISAPVRVPTAVDGPAPSKNGLAAT
jgi:hypothetical protein